MEFNSLFNCAIRVKEEPCDELLTDYDDRKFIDKAPDVKEDRFFKNYSILRECNDNNETNEMEIEAECKDVKPNVNLLKVKKINDNIKCTDDYKIRNIIKTETASKVKKELNFNAGCELVKNNEKRKYHKHSSNECGSMFKQKIKLKRHVKSAHKDITHTCQTCGKSFRPLSNLKVHVAGVHNGVKYKCDTCGKSFTQKSNLKTHFDAVHNGIRFTCDICGKSFSQNAYLYRHIKMHKGDRVTDKCNICLKTFTTRGYLLTHIESVHKGVSHKCQLCEKQCRFKSSLKKHIDAMHYDITHACVFCEKKYKSKSDLKKHVKSLHNGTTHM